MDVFEAVRTVLAVRQYDDRTVPDAVVRRIVEAARLTGSSMNRQPWHFVVVQERENLRTLGSLTRSGPYVADAALAIVVAVEKASPFGDAVLTLTDKGAGTLVTYVGEVKAQGAIARLGSRLLSGAAKLMVGQFMKLMEKQVEAKT